MEKFTLAKKLATVSKVSPINVSKQLNNSLNPFNLKSPIPPPIKNIASNIPPELLCETPKAKINTLFSSAKNSAQKKIEIDKNTPQPILIKSPVKIIPMNSVQPFSKIKIKLKTDSNLMHINDIAKEIKTNKNDIKEIIMAKEKCESINNKNSIEESKFEQSKAKIALKLKSIDEFVIIDDEIENIDMNKFNLWSEKYRPKNLYQIVGNQEQITEIRDWFTKFKAKDPNIKKALLLSGCPGTSKTTVAHAILHEFGYSIKEYNASDIRSKKLVEANLDKLITMEQIDKQLKHGFMPFGIIMDEVDGMSSGDKGGMTQLIKIINPNRGKRSVKKEDKLKVNNRWMPPIICICNNNYDKKIAELKKDCLEVKFSKPTVTELIRVINNVSKNENIAMAESAKKIIAEMAQGDFRRLMFLLQNFSNIKTEDNKPLEANDIYDYNKVISSKSLDLNTYDITNRILNKLYSVEDTLKMYETDKSLLPMMIHENYVGVIDAQHTTADNKLIACQKSIDSIITGDIIEKVMYNTQSWYLQPIHGLSACYVPSYYANAYMRGPHNKASFTQTLGRFSLQRANIKNIHLVMSMLNSGFVYGVDDIQLLSEIILFNLLDPNGNQNKGIQLLKNYNLSIKDLEKLIKMNKLSEKYKKLYKSRQKTQLTKLFGNVTQREAPVMTYSVGASAGSSDSKTLQLGGGKSTTKSKKKKTDEDEEDEEPESNDDEQSDSESKSAPKKRGRKPKTNGDTTGATAPKRKYTKRKVASTTQSTSSEKIIPKQKILLKKS